MTYNDAHECGFFSYVPIKFFEASKSVLDTSFAEFYFKGCITTVLEFDDGINFITGQIITEMI